MTLEEFEKMAKDNAELADWINKNADFIVSWKAIKYQKTIFRIGNMSKPGCRTWEQNGKKYMCFWDVVIERYTTCIEPMITYKKARN